MTVLDEMLVATWRDYPIRTRVLIEGVTAYAGGEDSAAGTPTILDGLSFTWGRTTNVDQPDAGTCSFVMHEELGGASVTPMLDVIDVDQSVEIWADIDIPATDTDPPTTESHLVWAGTVVSADGQAFGYSAFEVTVTAADATAPLADETIGDQPWPVQTLQTRVNRILQLAKTDTAPILIDPSLTGYQLTYRDVDAQPVLELLQDIAQSVGGVLWVATDADAGIYMWIEDSSNRAAMRQFVIDPDTGIVTIEQVGNPAALFSAGDLLRDPIHWTKDKTQAINSVDVGWQQQGIDSDGLPTTDDKTVTITAGTPKIIRKLSIGTELISELDATSLASKLLALVGGLKSWMASGLSIDTTVLRRDLPSIDYQQRLQTIIGLLDGKERLGRALTLIDLPEWTPGGATTSVYLEGGTYSLTDGRWTLDLNVSAASGQGKSATWADFVGTGVTWAAFDPSILWRDAWGVAGPIALLTGFGGAGFGVEGFGI